MKLRASTKILLGFVSLAALGFGGNYAFTKMSLVGVNLDPIQTGDVCLIALNKDSGVNTIVANHMVQIVESSQKFSGGGEGGGGATSGSVKKRIPVKELMGVLNGDSSSVEGFIRKMREGGEDTETFDDAPIWLQADIEKALKGDANLKSKLENDICMGLDGTPNPTVNRTAFFSGIRIKIPVTLQIPNAKGPSIQGFDIVNFKPKFLNEFYKSMSTRFYDKAQLQTYYSSFIKDQGPQKEDFAATMKMVFKRSQDSDELHKVQTIAQNTNVLVSQSMISKVELAESSDEKDRGKEKDATFDLKIHLTKDGKNRLWKFSSDGGTHCCLQRSRNCLGDHRNAIE